MIIYSFYKSKSLSPLLACVFSSTNKTGDSCGENPGKWPEGLTTPLAKAIINHRYGGLFFSMEPGLELGYSILYKKITGLICGLLLAKEKESGIGLRRGLSAATSFYVSRQYVASVAKSM